MIISTIGSVEISDKLRRARGAQIPKVSQKAAGAILGLSREAYVSYETGRVTPTDAQLQALGNAWGIPASWFVDGRDTPVPGRGYSVASIVQDRLVRDIGAPLYPVPGSTIEVPMTSAVPGGSWIAPEESTSFYEVSARLYKRGRWASPVVGDSMHPYLQQGDICIWEPNPHPKIGLIILARNSNNEVTAKQLQYTESGYTLIGLKDGEEMHASKWEALGFLIARVREGGPGRYSEIANEGGLRPEELI